VADVERTNIYPVFIAKHISPTILTVLEHQIRTHRDDMLNHVFLLAEICVSVGFYENENLTRIEEEIDQ